MSVKITVDGRTVDVDAGISVAAAMLNAGLTQFRTSVRGTPRGPLCAMGVCHECRVTVDGVAHRRSCLVEVANGMRIDTAIVSPRASAVAQVRQLSADVVVVGAGPAGIAAAATAAEHGASVVILDESPRTGGQIWRHRASTSLDADALQWIKRLERPNVTVLNGVTVAFATRTPEAILVAAESGLDAIEIRAAAMVIATGARELFLPFPGSTLPGVVGVGALQALLKSGTSVRRKRVVIAGTGPLLLPVAAMAAQQGARLEVVAEQAPLRAVASFASGLWRQPAILAQALGYRTRFLTTRFSTGTWVAEARGTQRLQEVQVTDGTRPRDIPCDILAAAHGLIPNTELARQVGCATSAGAVLVDDYGRTNVEGVHCAGEITGVGGVELALVEGMVAGLSAAGAREKATVHIPRVRSLRHESHRMAAAFALRPELRALARPETIVCRCEDVALRDIQPGWPMRKTKLYTRAGMGACQGRTCGAALDAMAGAGTDAVRLPVQPTLLTTLTAMSSRIAGHNDHGERHDG